MKAVGIELCNAVPDCSDRLSRYIGKLRRRAAELTDSRVKVMSEVLSGILAVKMSAWEGRDMKLMFLGVHPLSKVCEHNDK